jgi:tRNA dimethylallyltransferase
MNNMKKSPIIILYGPTAVGKTDISLALAQHLPVEIINIDVGQFYTPLSIGTAKPDWKSLPVPHHLFDIIDKPVSITVAQLRLLLIEKVEEIQNRNAIPMIVGGSGFYIRSLLFPIRDQQETTAVNNENEKYTTAQLWQQLLAVDPLRAASLQKTDRYRIMRSLDLYHAAGTTSTVLEPVYTPFSDYYLLYVSRDKAEINQRINQRVIEMLHNGWVDEAKSLLGTKWEDFLRHKKIIGYTDIFDYIQSTHEQPFDLLAQNISQKTRQYAKRQRTFWRKLERECLQATRYTGSFIGCIQTIDLTSKPVRLYISELLQSLSSLVGKKQ